MDLLTRLLVWLRGLRRRVNWYKLLKMYGIAALAHSTWKMAVRIYRFRYAMWLLRDVPGRPIDYTLSEFASNTKRLNHYRHEMMKGFDGAGLVRGTHPEIEVLCNSKETVKFLLKDGFASITKPSESEEYLIRLVKDFIGDRGIFTLAHGKHAPVEDRMWYRQRKTASKIFTRGQFTTLMYDVFVEKGQKLLEHLDKAAKANDSASSNSKSDGVAPVDMQEKFFCFTFDSIQKIFFSREVNSLERGSEDPFARAFDEAHRAMLRFRTKAAAPLLLVDVLPYPFGSLFVGARSNLGAPLFNLWRETHPDFRNFVENVQVLDQATHKIIAAARRDPKLQSRRDLLSNFLNQDMHMSDELLRDILLNFVIAGRDTTACTLTWMFFELAVNPGVQKRLAEELHGVLGGKVPSHDELAPANLPYLNGVLMETLRLHPPVPEDTKVAKENVQFPGGTVVPRGTKVLFVPYAMGRNPNTYPDPCRFDPERWIPFKQPDMFEFPVFQAGNRFCLGKDMAVFESKLVCSMIIQKYQFELEQSEDASNITYALSLTMSLCNNLDQTSHNLWLVPRSRTLVSES